MTQNSDAEPGGEITVVVDPEIKDIIPIFLDNRRGDVTTVLEALDQSDYESIRILGHSLRGVGGGYGFHAITALGKSLDEAARERNAEEIRKLVGELSSYLERVNVVYDE
jgi:HPt (histidine-containing phosphotransfer) domain-containing protein